MRVYKSFQLADFFHLYWAFTRVNLQPNLLMGAMLEMSYFRFFFSTFCWMPLDMYYMVGKYN